MTRGKVVDTSTWPCDIILRSVKQLLNGVGIRLDAEGGGENLVHVVLRHRGMQCRRQNRMQNRRCHVVSKIGKPTTREIWLGASSQRSTCHVSRGRWTWTLTYLLTPQRFAATSDRRLLTYPPCSTRADPPYLSRKRTKGHAFSARWWRAKNLDDNGLFSALSALSARLKSGQETSALPSCGSGEFEVS